MAEQPEKVTLCRRIKPQPSEPWEELPSRPYDKAKIWGNAYYEVATFIRVPEGSVGVVFPSVEAAGDALTALDTVQHGMAGQDPAWLAICAAMEEADRG